MNFGLENVLTLIGVVIVWVINNGKLSKQIFGTSKELIGLLAVVKDEIMIEVNKVAMENVKLKAIVTFLVKDKTTDLQARLEITNDPDEEKELLDKIKDYTDILI